MKDNEISSFEFGSFSVFHHFGFLSLKRLLLISEHYHILLLKAQFTGPKFSLLHFYSIVDLVKYRLTLWKIVSALYLCIPAKFTISIRSIDEKSPL
jgi:hypothetical protein